ncbi:MAG: thioredoxin family protein [Candidatus Eisenbacteria sp.]|nr:thioredoxin family protein [Candidatus Eisenbacteria bacterium]
MGLLKPQDKSRVAKQLAELKGDVTLVMFTQSTECQFCEMTREMVTEVAEVSPKLHLEVHDFVADAALAKEYGIEKIPAIVLLGERDQGIRFYGIPAGYEFASFIDAILTVGGQTPELPPEANDLLSRIEKPVDLQVMVTPTCPYCPAAVRVAHRLALASDQITGAMVEISEFPQLAIKYGVQGVPMTVINETHKLAGAQSETNVLEEILKALESSP